MRQLIPILFLFMPSFASAAEKDPALQPQFLEVGPDFQLGGAVSRSALTAAPEETRQERQPRLSLPITPSDTTFSQMETTFGGATLFMGEGLDGGRDAVQMGTFIRRGQARAGVSVTYLENEAEVSRSELFFDYSLTEQFSIGLSGILNAEISEDETVPQLGLSAEFATESGAFLQGGVSDASDYQPVIGVSIGLRF